MMLQVRILMKPASCTEESSEKALRIVYGPTPMDSTGLHYQWTTPSDSIEVHFSLLNFQV